jgi:hypothetical protein
VCGEPVWLRVEMLVEAQAVPATAGEQAPRLIGAPAFPSIVKDTVPVGLFVPEAAATFAVNVTFWPYVEGFAEDVTLVVVLTVPGFTICDTPGEVLPL